MGLLDHHARGFTRQPVECDVVLPFHGHLSYVREALNSILEQDSAEAIVHLIDDATPGGADDLLRYWGSHPRVRTYRNARNIGQFQSFNNVFPYFETGLVAVQDADDISRPDRLHRSGNLLRLADSDVFGGRSELFGDVPAESSGRRDSRPRRKPLFAPSVYPYQGAGFFLENPTAMFRVATFEAVRGFADYGDLDCNKCGLDTEFYARAFYSGARFAISRRVVVDYRVHGDSAVRNRQTGFGSDARLWSEAENHRRFHMFQRGPFDPRILGALHAAPWSYPAPRERAPGICTMNADSPLRVVPALVAYYTADWIQVAVTSYLEHFPADRILVVDNNPRRGEPGWDPDCERERYWLRAHPQVDHVVNTLTPCGSNGERLHGLGVDMAVQWCRDRVPTCCSTSSPIVSSRAGAGVRTCSKRFSAGRGWPARTGRRTGRSTPPPRPVHRSTPRDVLRLGAGRGLVPSALRRAD